MESVNASTLSPDVTVVVPVTSRDTALTRAYPIFAPGSVFHTVMLVVIALFPFEVFSLDVGTTKIDLSNVLFAPLALWTAASSLKHGLSAGFRLFLLVYIAAETIMFFAGPAPVSRFAAAFVWLTSIFLVFGSRDHVPIDARAAFRVVLAGIAALTVAILYQYVFEGNDRPAGLMAEPSPAGMILLGGVAGLLISSRWAATTRQRMTSYLIAFGLFGLSIITKTTHIVSFAITLVMIGALSRSLSARTIIGGLLFLGVVYWLLTFDPHYQSRMAVSDASSNLSLLSWLQGFDQMVSSLKEYPLIGGGLGATGQFDFYSSYTPDLYRAGLGELNKQDAYSGLFRLVIELGPLLVGVIIYAIAKRLIELWKAAGEGALPVCAEARAQMFLFTFATELIVGIMLKEPTYSRSYFVVAAVLFSLVPLRAVVRVPLSLVRQSGAHAAM